MIKIYAVGGYNDVGKNCTAIQVDDEIVIVDLGLHLESYIQLTEDEDFVKISDKKLMQAGAVPDISFIETLKDQVQAIVIGHAHLDHVGAVPFLADRFNVPIYGTPFTMEVLQQTVRDNEHPLPNEIKVMQPNSKQRISDKLTLELIHITHSTPHTAVVAIHTPYGSVVYANDFKLDATPTFGDAPNFERFKELGNENVVALICESTYANDASKTPSEAVAKEMLEKIMLDPQHEDNLIVVTTFSSHIARLNSIVEFAKKLNRNILFMGRSLAKYTFSAQNVELIDFTADVEVLKYSKQIERKLKKIDASRKDYVIVMTGHQGEPKAVLNKIARGEIKFKFMEEDVIIFSCKTIPTPTNIANREALEAQLRENNIQIYTDIHQSGHAAREDLREFIEMIKPQCVIPAHGNNDMKKGLVSLAEEMGYAQNKTIFLVNDGESVEIPLN